MSLIIKLIDGIIRVPKFFKIEIAGGKLTIGSMAQNLRV